MIMSRSRVWWCYGHFCCRPKSLLWEGERGCCFGLKQAVPGRRCRGCVVCLGAACPFLCVPPRPAGGSALQRASFRGDTENVTALSAGLLHVCVEEGEGKHPGKGDLCSLPSAAMASGGEDAICYHLAPLSRQSTERVIVLDLGWRSWQCARLAAVSKKR